MSLDVDAIAPVTPELEAVALRRADLVMKEWGRLIAIHGCVAYPSAAGDEQTIALTGTRALAVACYLQGVRDATAVAATMGEASR